MAIPKRAPSNTPNGSPCCSNTRPCCDARSASRHAPAPRAFVNQPPWRTDYRATRGLDRALFRKLTTCEWIRTRRNLFITGPCGVGKSWLACALGHKACKEDFSVLYHRIPRLFAALALARGDGRYAKLLRALGRVKLLILDDWGPETLLPEQARDLLEIVEDRYDAGSILLTSQAPIDRWHDIIGNPTLADAILDRIVHNAYKVELAGESMRKRRILEPSA